MEAAWKKTKENPVHNAKIVHAENAYYANCWVYSTKTGKIYTPREFIESNEVITFHRGKESDSEFKIVDPRMWLQKKLMEVANNIAEVTMLQSKINDYFEVKAKPKKK